MTPLNLILIMLWILVPIYGLAEGPVESGSIGVPYTPGQVLVNGVLAGGFFLMGFYRAQGTIMARFPWLVVDERKDPRSR